MAVLNTHGLEVLWAQILEKIKNSETNLNDKIENQMPELKSEAEIIEKNTEMEIENNAQE
jgi:hypothetical protein